MSVTPKKAFGQHFLVDENILGVIGRLADLRPEDVVLEVGPGLGVLTRYLADRVRLVHAIEIDRSLEAPLADALQAATNVHLMFGDAVGFEYSGLAPLPGKLVSNLPYNVATPVVVESIYKLPSLERWTLMVQREVAERFFASPRTKAYGAVSVLVQLHAHQLGSHRVSPAVFRPRPNVDSTIVAFERVSRPYPDRIRHIISASFAHRRKTLVNSLSRSGLVTREEAARALSAIGRSNDARAEELEPTEFVAFADALR